MARTAFVFSASLDNKLSNTIVPLTTARVNISIELTGSDALRVQNVSLGFIVRARSIVLERSDSVLKYIVVHGLTTTSRSYKHESMTHLDGIVELDDLVLEDWSVNQLEVFERVLDGVFELTIVHLGLANSREQILNNVSK